MVCSRQESEETLVMSRAVLITGCSSGIGRATALRLAQCRAPVYATARQIETIEDLATWGCRVLRLDVCDEASMRAAVTAVEEAEGAVGVLVNNAGYGLEGAVEELAPEALRRQFETNVFGPVRLTQLVLPGMRRQRWGRIINVSSVGGRITVPGGGAYHASKHAVEAFSDVLRFEVRGFGIDVVVIEPGAIASRWVEKSVAGIESLRDTSSPYASFDRAVARRLLSADEGVLALAARSPEAVAKVVELAAGARRPRARYVVPGSAHAFTISHRLLPDRAWDAVMRRMFPAPSSAG
jgi:NAD(P)-dependent dehydrogenase (short-subunit alcohol dehydrogenase family)